MLTEKEKERQKFEDGFEGSMARMMDDPRSPTPMMTGHLKIEHIDWQGQYLKLVDALIERKIGPFDASEMALRFITLQMTALPPVKEEFEAGPIGQRKS